MTTCTLSYEGSPACPLKRLEEPGWPAELPVDEQNNLDDCPPMPDFFRIRLCESDHLAPYADVVQNFLHLQEEELKEFYYLYVYALPDDVDRIFRQTLKQSKSSIWKKERQVLLLFSFKFIISILYQWLL